MIGPDLVRARRRGDQLVLQKLAGADEEIAVDMGAQLLAAAQASLGLSQEELEEALGAVDREARHEKLWAGLRKLVLDRCAFGAPTDFEPVELRKAVFGLAAKLRGELEPGQRFERAQVIERVARERSLPVEVLEEALFGDLKGAQRLSAVAPETPEGLVEAYHLAQLQGVLVRAVQLRLRVQIADSEQRRHLFRKLKFRQLLYRIQDSGSDTFELLVDGPFSMFGASTKYGMQLALLVPALLACQKVVIEADVQWGKERKPLRFKHELRATPSVTITEAPLRPELEQLIEAVEKKASPWKVEPAAALLDLPGVGTCIPDLLFTRPGHPPVYLELLGFWSRSAVWDRVEWAQARDDPDQQRILFAVSQRLRVSEEVLPAGKSAALYVFKGTLSARQVLEHVEQLASS